MFGQWMGDNKIIIYQDNRCPVCGRQRRYLYKSGNNIYCFKSNTKATRRTRKKDKIIDEIKQLIEENLKKDTIFEHNGFMYGFNECQYVTRQIVEILREYNILKRK